MTGTGIGAAGGPRQDEYPLVAFDECLEIAASHVESYIGSPSPDFHGAICLSSTTLDTLGGDETSSPPADLT